jgi:hypothetical protein
MEHFSHETLTIEAGDRTANAIELVWKGRSRSREPGAVLTPYLTKAVGWAADRNVSLEMRFDRLDFFNSATVMVLIQCIHLARSRSVRLRLLYAAESEWQKLSFDPIRILQKDELLEISSVRNGDAATSVGVA